MVRECLRVRELRLVDTFGFHRVKERFHGGVVCHLPAKAVHALHEAEAGEPVAVAVGAVFGAAVAVEDGSRLGLPLLDRVVERPHGEVGVTPFAHGPADDPPGELVQNDGEVTPFTACSEVRDISGPHLIRSGWDDAIAVVRDAVEELLHTGLESVDSGTAGLDASDSHEPLNPLAPDTDTVFAQRVVDSWAAVEIAALAMDRLDLLPEGFIFNPPATAAPKLPGIVAGAGNSVESAHHFDFVVFPVLLDVCEDFGFRSEQNRMAFFKSSCSSFKRACSFSNSLNLFRSDAISASSLLSPLCSISPSRDSLRQRVSRVGWINSASATSCTCTPGTLLSRTAVLLNSLL